MTITNVIPAPERLFHAHFEPSGIDLKLKGNDATTPHRLMAGEGDSRLGVRLHHGSEVGLRLRKEQIGKMTEIAANATSLAQALACYDTAAAEEWAGEVREQRRAESRERQERELAEAREAARYFVLPIKNHLLRDDANLPRVAGEVMDTVAVDMETGLIALANTDLTHGAMRGFEDMIRRGAVTLREDSDRLFVDVGAARALLVGRDRSAKPTTREALEAWLMVTPQVRRIYMDFAQAVRGDAA